MPHPDDERRPPRAAHHAPSGGFRNPWPGAEPHGFGALLRWWRDRRLHPPPPDPPPGHFARHAPSIAAPRLPDGACAATWIGHSTVLLQLGALNVLTDPMWSERASPVSFAGPKRLVPPALPLEELPPLDLILQSHSHYDHLDRATVRRLARAQPQAHWVAPLGLAPLLRGWGVQRVSEHDWWEEARPLGRDDVRVRCTPAQHFSARTPWDRDETLWCGWSLAVGARRVFFAGDTALHPEFGEIGRRDGPFDLLLLPVGAYEPRWFMRSVHMNPDDAMAAYDALHGAHGASAPPALLPIHWGTFRLTDEPADEPAARTRTLWRARGLPEERLWLLAHGETRAEPHERRTPPTGS